MKKLLGLLGVLTITGNGLSTLTSNSLISTNILTNNHHYLQVTQNDPTIQQDINNKRFIKILRDGTGTYIPNGVSLSINEGIVLREVQLRYLVTPESDGIAGVEQQESLLRTYHPEKIPASQASQNLQYDENGESIFTHGVSNARVKFLDNQRMFVQYLNNKYKEEQRIKERKRIAAQAEYNARVQAQQQAEREYYRTKLNEFNSFKANNRASGISNLMGPLLTPLVSNTINYQGGNFTLDGTPVTLLGGKLKIDNVGCNYIMNVLSTKGFAAAATALSSAIGLLMASLPPILSTIAAASVTLNIFIIQGIIENKNQGNGVGIGFGINQPGIGGDSL